MELNTITRRCRRLLGLMLLGTSIHSLGAPATPANTLTLQDALTRTLTHNPALYQYRFHKAALLASKQNDALSPALAVELNVENIAGTGAKQGVQEAETTLALSSMIELGGKQQARLTYADARIRHAQYQHQATSLDVLAQLTTHYIESLATQANRELAQRSLDFTHSLLDTMSVRAQRGATPEAEVLRAKAAVARADMQLTALQRKFERQKIQLARYWGETQTPFQRLDGSLFEFGASEPFAELYQRAQRSPALQVFASEKRLQEAQLSLAHADQRSDLTWRLGVKHFAATDDAALTAGVSMPLFANQRGSTQVKAAQAKRDAIDYAETDQRLRLHAQLFNAYSLRQQGIDNATKMAEVVIPALEQALELTQTAYDNGRYQYQDLMAAREELLAARQARIDAATTALVSQALIEQLTGAPFTQ
ncbi:TolC family protein [Gilvimarinus agarilyticus]|uniref:TolC family protein n=1 Tax=Gilvimarinus sp. 2_MG-2023 TaxID=3062666 RepID=UPI001C08D644|nr:TolC family protein [Gilvimarinus sp. 2_MG-2023]MBU2885685.1 TolC family protein [Gilvimarinus agarilyticus]MDO6570545.1 TolC family protein [Gilvimarinus sp. 2_MG-2023]